MMREEITAAVLFLGRVLDESDSHTNHDKVELFTACLSAILEQKFQGHWHTEAPSKGQAFRSIRIHPTEPLDPVLQRAASGSGLSSKTLSIPVELTLWVDPREVCCRFGDLKATYCTVLSNQGGSLDNRVNVLDVRDLLDSAKAQYSRQQQIRILRNSPPPNIFGSYTFSLPYELTPDSFSPPSNAFHPLHHYMGVSDGSLGDTDGYDDTSFGYHLPSSPSHYTLTFTPTALNTTSRQRGSRSSAGNFGKSTPSSIQNPKGTSGQNPRLSQPSQQQWEGSAVVRSVNNNLTPTLTSNRSSSDHYHWFRSGKGSQQTSGHKDNK